MNEKGEIQQIKLYRFESEKVLKNYTDLLKINRQS